MSLAALLLLGVSVGMAVMPQGEPATHPQVQRLLVGTTAKYLTGFTAGSLVILDGGLIPVAAPSLAWFWWRAARALSATFTYRRLALREGWLHTI